MKFLVSKLRAHRVLLSTVVFTGLYVTLAFNHLEAAATSGARVLSAEEQEKTVYGQLAKLHLPSLAKQQINESQEAEEIKRENDAKLKESQKVGWFTPAGNIKDVQVPELGSVEKLNLAYQVFALNDYAAKRFITPTPVLNENVFHDLEILCGSKSTPNSHVFEKINNTQTAVGGIELQKMLFTTTNDVELLQKRQQAIAKLVKDEKLMQSLSNHLEKIKIAENEMFWFWKSIDEAVNMYFNKVYFPEKSKSEVGLETYALWKTVGAPVFWASYPVLAMYITYKLIHHVEPRAVGGRSFWDWMHNCYVRPFTEPNVPGIVKLLLGSSIALILVADGASVYGAVKNSIEYNKISNMIQQKMINVATYTNSMSRLGKLVEGNAELKTLFPEYKSLIRVADGKRAEDAKELIHALRTDTFKGQPSFFSHKGRVLASFKKMFDEKDNIVSALKTAGQIDAYVSIAKLYKQYENNENARYCFVEYAASDKPYVKIDEYWHPFLNPKTVVTNSIELGGNLPNRDIILTGPNAAGKSTALKSITLALILAQSFGIAPAKSMTLTPFAKINTYLNIADSEGRESLFQAEMNRAQALLNSIRSLKKREFSFVIMDEIFTGTNPEEGQAGAYAVAKNLATFNNCMAVVATHYKKLTELEKDTASVYKNYKVYVNQAADGSFTFPYKMVEGTSNQAIALQLLAQGGFSSQIVQDAYNIMNSSKK